MMHYTKGHNVEEELTKENLPFTDCLPKGDKDFLWMQVKGGTKVPNVIDYAKKALDKGEYRTVVWSGCGGGVGKTISCAEIIKRSYPLYQFTRFCYKKVEEHWEPQMEGLEQIVAHRQIPCIHILMSLDELDEKLPGLQKPNTTTQFWVEHPPPTTSRQDGHQQKRGNAHGSSSSGQANRNDRNKQNRQKKPPTNQQKSKNQRKERSTNPESMET